MNEKSKRKRQQRVRKQKLLQQEKLRQETKEKNTRERLQYLTRQRQTPIVNPDDSILERNIKVLEQAMAEHEALQKFREENKDAPANMVEEAKKDQAEYAKNWNVAEKDVASIFETTTAGFAPAPEET